MGQVQSTNKYYINTCYKVENLKLPKLRVVALYRLSLPLVPAQQ